MNNFDNRHMQIITDSSKFAADLNTLFYADSNEKSVLRHKLKLILEVFQYQNAIDLGAGPGLVSDVLQQHAKNLTLVEITPDYYQDLKKTFPQARIEIQSVLDFNFSQQYDLMLFSHVLYYIAIDEWEKILKKLYSNLMPGGKLIVTHAPCHHIHKIFKTTLARNSHIAYIDEHSIDQLMNRIGPHSKDYYLSTSYYNDKPTQKFAKKFINYFFGITDELFYKNCYAQLDQLLTLFTQVGDKLGLEYHSDLYTFKK